MAKITSLLKNKAILIVLAILILCGIIAFMAFLSMYSDKTPAKSFYVYLNIK